MILDIVTILIAIYGAILSTAIFISKKKEKQYKLRAAISYGFIPFPDGSADVVVIEAVNLGFRSITLEGAGLELPNKATIPILWPMYFQFPFELKEGKSCRVWLRIDEISKALHEGGYPEKIAIKGFYRDALGTTHYSKHLDYSIGRWLSEEKAGGQNG